MEGQMVHVEIPAGDTAKAREFWGGLLGWQLQPFDWPVEYHMTQLTDTQGAAVMAADGDKRGPRVYFGVENLDAANARVDELGGSAGEVVPVPPMGRFSICQDTEGNEFGLWQQNPDGPRS